MDADGYIILVISQTSIAVRGYDKTQIARDKLPPNLSGVLVVSQTPADI
jgi:hypothetical protein